MWEKSKAVCGRQRVSNAVSLMNKNFIPTEGSYFENVSGPAIRVGGPVPRGSRVVS